MATSSITISPLAASVAATGPRRPAPRKVRYLAGMNSFSGLKAGSGVVAVGLPVSTEQSFARIVSSLRAPKAGGGKGGSASSTCNAAVEIFRIAAIMNGLVLAGVAVGFVLLRMEAFVEESEA